MSGMPVALGVTMSRLTGRRGESTCPGAASSALPCGWPGGGDTDPAAFDTPERVVFLLAKAEVSRLHRALDATKACTRQALQL